jgi:hypothetical protein
LHIRIVVAGALWFFESTLSRIAFWFFSNRHFPGLHFGFFESTLSRIAFWFFRIDTFSKMQANVEQTPKFAFSRVLDIEQATSPPGGRLLHFGFFRIDTFQDCNLVFFESTLSRIAFFGFFRIDTFSKMRANVEQTPKFAFSRVLDIEQATSPPGGWLLHFWFFRIDTFQDWTFANGGKC